METLKKYFFLTFGIALVIWSFYTFLNSPAPAYHQPKTENYKGLTFVKVGDNYIEVEVVETGEAKSRGLSGRESLGEGRGMLFIFEAPATYGFWMKDMKFPIDIVWIDENWQVVGVEKAVAPETFPKTFVPERPIKYVLELNSGEAVKLGIDMGTKLFFTP